MQNFLSAATGIAVLVALTRGLIRRETDRIGNFWVDLTRVTLYVLLPLSTLLAIVLVSQGVVQSTAPYRTVALLEPLVVETPAVDAQGEPVTGPDGAQVMEKTTVTEQTVPLGPAASQIAIKQLGTNGGGFFNVNSAHPFENPTPLSNFLEVLAILVISGALCYTFGHMVRDTRQGWALLAAMLVIFVPLLIGAVAAEQAGTLRLRRWARTSRPPPCSRAATWRARKSASASGTPRSGRPRPPPRRTGRSIRCTTRSRRWAGWCRCGSCSWARSCSAA